MFRYRGGFLVNEHGKVMDIDKNRDFENQNIQVWNKHGRLNQQWDVTYVDQWEKEPTKGQLNKDFGIVVERNFYVVSRMRSGRYLDVVDGRNIVIKTRNGRNTQEWYFDQKSKTIKNRSNNQSWDISKSGKSTNLQVWKTNSGWW
jgi:hypothetical protein